MPKNIFLVRHGLSEANLAHDISPDKDLGLFRKTPDFNVRLAPKGVDESVEAGNWLKEVEKNYNVRTLTHLFVSPYVRARETAAMMGLTGEWQIDDSVRERNWGSVENMPQNEAREAFPSSWAAKDKNQWYWQPPDGESLATDVLIRARVFLESLEKLGPLASVVVVSHAEFLSVLRFLIEGQTSDEWLLEYSLKEHSMKNGQVTQYAWSDCPNNGHSLKRRSIVPWDHSMSWDSGKWIEFPVKRAFSSAQLLETIATYPKVF